MSTVTAFFAVVSLEETLPMLVLSLIGSAVWIGLFLCVRRFDVDQGNNGDGKDGGGGGSGPRPDRPAGPLEIVDPPLGEIRASRRRSSAEPVRERREPIPS